MKYKDAVAFLEANALAILSQAPETDISFLAVGDKNGGPINEATDFAINAYVPKKKTERELIDSQTPSFAAAVASSGGTEAVESVELNVVESGSSFHPQMHFEVPVAQRGQYGGSPPPFDAQRHFATLRCGIGLTNPVKEYPQNLSVGTLGFFLRDSSGKRYLVSNSHVIGRSGLAQPGEVVVQPGTLDLTTVELQQFSTMTKLKNALSIAQVTAVVPFQFTSTPSGYNTVDAAMAILDDPGRNRSEIDRICFAGCLKGVASPYRVNNQGKIVGSARVYKAGRTTGMTEGVVVGLAGTGILNYPTGSAIFKNQIVVQATPDNGSKFSDRGDSGSGVLNDQHELVGLLFAGSNQQTLVNPIDAVLKELRTASGISSLQVVTG